MTSSFAQMDEKYLSILWKNDSATLKFITTRASN